MSAKERGKETEKYPDVGWSQKLRFYHGRSGLSLKGLARQSGVSEKVIVGLEEGSIMHPDIDDLHNLTLAFDITFDDLLYPSQIVVIETPTERGTEWGVATNCNPEPEQYFSMKTKQEACALRDWLNAITTSPCGRKPEEYDPSFRK